MIDADSVWLSDPVPHMNIAKSDILVQMDVCNTCGGFLLLHGKMNGLYRYGKKQLASIAKPMRWRIWEFSPRYL